MLGTDAPTGPLPADAGADISPILRISSYKIVRVLGEGSMGIVYLAEQDNPHREVALKVLKAGVASGEALRRFEHEAQTLGRLQHPGIAQVFEAGAADTGQGPRPFFAMELIQGLPLTRYADAHHLNTRERLALMARVCDGVQYAHRKGVIHRDLKPGNILVDDAGQPKILDFGIALASDRDTHSARSRTGSDELAGTVPYMSHEQLAGDPGELDTRVDVYSLGVIIYQLLSGRLPYNLKDATIPEAAVIIAEQNPVPLGVAVTALRGDIERIVSKALEREKGRRYQSASDLGADIRRYLADEPISARPPDATYLAAKFAKRNKTLVAGVAGVFMALLAGVAGTTIGLLDAIEARSLASEKQKEAERQAAIAKAVNDFLNDDLLAAVAPEEQGRDVSMRQVLDKASEAVERKFADEPEIEASIRMTLGNTYRLLGELDDAETHFRSALGTYRDLFGDVHPDTLAAMNELALLLKSTGRLREAERLYRKALSGRTRILGGEHPDTLETLHNMAALLMALGKLDEAESRYREALYIQRRNLGDEHPNTLTSYNRLAYVLELKGSTKEAERVYRRVLDARRRVLGEEHPQTLITKSNLATLLQDSGHLNEAERLYTTTLESRRKVLGDDHPRTLASMSNLAALLQRQGRLAEAELLYRDTVARLRKKLGVRHPTTIASMFGLAALLAEEGQLDEAESLHREVLGLRRKLLPPGHAEIAGSLIRLGILLMSSGDTLEAESFLRECVAIRRGAYPEGDWRIANAENALGACLTQLGRYEEAEPLLLSSLPIIRSEWGEGEEHTKRALKRIVELYAAWGRPRKASEYRAALSSSLEYDRGSGP